MGRPKGSKNGTRKEGKVSARKYAVSPKTRKVVGVIPKVKASAKMPKAVKQQKSKAQPSEQYTELTSMVLELARTQRLMLATLTTILSVHRAGFVDAWMQFVENSLKNDREPTTTDFMQLFAQTTKILGLSVQELDSYVALRTDLPVSEVMSVPLVSNEEKAVETLEGHSLNVI